MRTRTSGIKLSLVVLTFGVWSAAMGQTPVITSFSQNGELICTNLQPGSVVAVEWASAVTGPWTNNWAGLDAVTADSNGMIRVSVPMFYRVRATTNSAPAGMVLVPPGNFTMGDNLDGSSFALPLHEVYVSAFYMDKYEVTKALRDTVYNWATNNGYSFDSTGSGKAATHPAQNITWHDSVKWCNARSEMEGKTPAYYTDAAQTTVYRSGDIILENAWVKWDRGYRLPTEAEWEKAARGGASGHRFSWADTDNITHSRANYFSSTNIATSSPYDTSPTHEYHPTFNDGVEPYTSPTGYFSPNGYGLYDMIGNVWEWCWEVYGAYSSSTQIDPRGPISGSGRVVRGGCYSEYASNCRTAYRRDAGPPTGRSSAVGFRCVMAVGQ